MDPLLVLLLGLLTVVGLIAGLRVHPFLALIAGAMVVSFVSPLSLDAGSVSSENVVLGADWGEKITRVAEAFGTMAGKIALLITLGAIIGQILTESGAAERIVLVLCRVFGIKRLPAALLTSGFVLSIPVFYDVTFYLLLPLAKTVYRLTKRNYILYLLSIGFGATLSHSLVPPTPGPLVVSGELGVSLGAMILVGALVGLLTIPFALGIAMVINRLTPNPERTDAAEAPLSEDGGGNKNTPSFSSPKEADLSPTLDEILARSAKEESSDRAKRLPTFFWAILPLLLPVVLIATSATVETMAKNKMISAPATWENVVYLLGNPTVALFLSAVAALTVWRLVRRISFKTVEKMISAALVSAGVIILITSAGGAFGATLRAGGVGERIQEIFATANCSAGPLYLILAFAVTAVIKTAQGSSTTAMITTAGIFAAMNPEASALGFHVAYLAAAIGAGAMVTGWMNDSGFCIFAGMSGISETSALKTWTVGLVFLGLSALLVTLTLSAILPLT